MKRRMTVEVKRDLVKNIDELSKTENISIKDACKRLYTPYSKYFYALKMIKYENKKAWTEARTLAAAPLNNGLKVEMSFNGDTAKLIREYAEAYGVEPEAVCKIMIVDALKKEKADIA